jgi:hypothetical protein
MIKPNHLLKSLQSVSLITGVLLLVNACAVPPDSSTGGVPSAPIPPAKLYSGASVTGAWTPDLSIVNGGVTNFVKGADVTTGATITRTGAGMVRFNDPWGSKEITVPLGHYDAADFGVNGSITLQAEVSGYPRAGGAYAVLTGFSVLHIPPGEGGGSREYVNLSTNCASSGAWTCSGSNCYTAPSCAPLQTGSKSSFFSRNDWEQHQIPSYGYATTNSFPRCDSGVSGWDCPAGMSSLPTGDYYAKYILVSNSGSSVASLSASLNVTPIIKKDAVARDIASSNGAVNINVILVGGKNIDDSHTTRGQQNLNLLFKETHNILKNNSNIGINQIKVYEWNDIDGGDYYAQVPYSNVGVMFSSGSQAVDAADNANNINIFMVRSITQSFNSQIVILGISGGILGPSVNGTLTSGLAFSTSQGAGSLLAYNAGCAIGTCSRDDQDSAFIEMGATVAHEIGHYLGLNHPAETTASIASQAKDQLNDTPTCSPRTLTGGTLAFDQLACYSDSTAQANPLSGTSCKTACDAAITAANSGVPATYFNTANPDPAGVASLPVNFCPAVAECQFNHVMWYTTKNRVSRSGHWLDDGNLISPQSKAILQWNSFVR